MAKQGEFTALVLEEKDGKVTSAVKSLPDDALPEGDVTVAVAYSTVNYKDGMILNGLGKLVKAYPHVPGIDFAGTVEASRSPRFKAGDPVILTGWRVGEIRFGGYATRARVPGEWLVPVPKGLDPKQAMAIGTAGFTAMLAVMALEDHGLRTTDEGEVLVTGAAGGVGSVAVAMLAAAGYRVAASTGRRETHDYLRRLGAASLVERAELEAPPKGPLGKERWAGAVDNVAGTTLANLLTQLRHGASCAAVGLAGGAKLETTVIPFLLRGVNLLGIDSAVCPMERRVAAWMRLAAGLPRDKLSEMTSVATLADLPALAGKILQGQVKGRVVVDVRAPA
jgi:acrylyl-CoA reductase (NADPH)